MNEPPAEIDGARVELYASIGPLLERTGATRHSVSNFNELVSRLAIAKYEDTSETYLFYCDEGWSVVTDTCHATVDEAIAQAEFEFSGVRFVPRRDV